MSSEEKEPSGLKQEVHIRMFAAMVGTYTPTKGLARVAISQRTIPKLKDNISESNLAKWQHTVSNRFRVINLDHFKKKGCRIAAHSRWITAVTCISHTPCCRHGGCFPVSGGGRSTASGSLCPQTTFSSTTQSLEAQNLPAENNVETPFTFAGNILRQSQHALGQGTLTV